MKQQKLLSNLKSTGVIKMANNIEAYCEVCGKETTHFAYSDGWECDECDSINSDIYANPYKEEF